jgi:hypothetical protein
LGSIFNNFQTASIGFCDCYETQKVMPDHFLSLEEWEAKYQPIQNHLRENAPWDGIWFDTMGDEDKFVREQNPFNVWSYEDRPDDEEAYIVSGYRYGADSSASVRLGFFITKNPWVDGEDIQIPIEDSED